MLMLIVVSYITALEINCPLQSLFLQYKDILVTIVTKGLINIDKLRFDEANKRFITVT